MASSEHSRISTIAAFCVALAAGVYAALHIYDPVIRPILDVLPPFAIAFVFAFLLDPLVDWIQRLGGSRVLGVVIVGIAFLVAFLAVGFLLVPRVAEQAGSLAGNFGAYTDRARETVDGLLMRARPLLSRLHLPTTVSELGSRFSVQIEEGVSRSLSYIAASLGGALSRILWVVVIPLATLWLLRDLDYIKAKIVHLTPERHKDRLMSLSAAVGGVLGRYVRGMLAVAIIHSIVASVVLTAAGLDYALIIGGVSGLLYLVPYVGNATTMLAAGIAALAQPGHSLAYAGGLMAGLAVQSFIVFDLWVTPRVVGGSVGVHPVLALFSLWLGVRLFGVTGMIVAVPVAAACQVAIGQFCPGIYDRISPVANTERSLQEDE